MRILHCIPSMGGGGAERQLTYLIGGLTRLGWEMHVALLAGGPNWERLHSGGAVIHQVKSRTSYNLKIFWQLKQVIRQIEPDLVHTWLLLMDIFGGLASWTERLPWILTENSSGMAYSFGFKDRWRIALTSSASAVVSNSTGGDQYWHTRLNKRVARYVIPNALPLDEIAAVQPIGLEETGLGPEQGIVLFVGRFSPEKNLETLLLVLRTVLSRPQTVAVLCGEGPLYLQVKQCLNTYAIADRVRLLGFVSDVWRWMKRASVLVSLSLFEGAPNVVLEAMACGCPLVVSDISAHRELLDTHSALLVDAHAPKAIAEAIVNVLSVPEAAARRAQRAQAKVAQWSISSVAQQYAQVYHEVLTKHVRSRRKSQASR